MQLIEEAGEENEKNVAIAEIENITEITSEPGFIDLAIRPGHEGESCEWLQEMSLLPQTMKCVNTVNNVACDTLMHWNEKRNLDLYQWICSKCDAKINIRDNTVFKLMKCSLNTALRSMVGWCKNIEMEETAEILRTELTIVKRLYDICSIVAKVHFRRDVKEFRYGGCNEIVVVDIFPAFVSEDVFEYYQQNNNNIQPILCVGEIKDIPTNFHFHAIEDSTNRTKEDIILESVMKIKEIVNEGTTIVVNSQLDKELINTLRGCIKYTLIGTEELATFDTPVAKTLSENLQTIWTPAVTICEEAQKYGSDINDYLIEQMWRFKFVTAPSIAFEYLLRNFSDCWGHQLLN